jgi:hypothetical protein
VIDIDQQPDVGIELPARVEEDGADSGKVVWLAPARAARELARMVGQEIRVSIVRFKKRSPRANRYYWGGVITFLLGQLTERAMEVGQSCPFESKEELHDYFKAKFIGVTLREFLGETYDIPPSSAKLSVEQFGAYIECICAWAAHRGIYVPRPDEWTEERAA